MSNDPGYCLWCGRDGGPCAVCGGGPSLKDTPAPMPKLKLHPTDDAHTLDPAGYYERKAVTRWEGMAHVLILGGVLAVGGAVGWLVSWLFRVQ